MNTAKQNLRQRMIDGAKRYAKAERSDPFAFNVAMSHINSGIAGLHAETGKEAFYDAKPVQVKCTLPKGVTLSDGSDEYEVTEYRGVVRP